MPKLLALMLFVFGFSFQSLSFAQSNGTTEEDLFNQNPYEDGQLDQTTFPLLAGIIGRDSRNDPESHFTSADKQRFNQIGILRAEGVSCSATIRMTG